MPNSLQRFTLASYPRAIIHFDADAFFTSVEQALQPALKGKPVVTGKERGLIACASYEAKTLGINRGFPLWEAMRVCPDLVVLPSDYETYSLYSKRMFNIVRRFTPVVEEHSVDEGFADISGLRRMYRSSYKEVPALIQKTIKDELDVSVSVGLSLTKVLAKLASGFRKPGGKTSIPGHGIHFFLSRLPLDKVWGFGPNTVHLLNKFNLRTAYDFATRPEHWAEGVLGKKGREIWHELRGSSQYRVEPNAEANRLSVSKCKSFSVPSRDRDEVWAQMVRNVESAFMKLRRHHMRCTMITIGLRGWDFCQRMADGQLETSTGSPQEAMPLVASLFNQLYQVEYAYRTVIVVLGGLQEGGHQLELFEDRRRADDVRISTRVVDEINQRYGKHSLRSAATLYLHNQPVTERDVEPARRKHRLPGETARRRLHIPRMSVDV